MIYFYNDYIKLFKCFVLFEFYFKFKVKVKNILEIFVDNL